jgi:cell division protein FtsW
MPSLSRADTSVLGRWWWTVDRWTLLALGTLIFFGYVMMLAASPAVAERIHEARELLIIKQVVFLAAAALIIVMVSLLSPQGVRRVAMAGCVVALLLTAMTLVMGTQIKGGQRWIHLPGMSMQPSEFLKPCFAVTAAWLISEGKRTKGFPGTWIAIGIYGVIAVLLKSQPDIGMLAVVTLIFIAQLFLGGLHMAIIGGLAGLAVVGGALAYQFDRHVADRVNKFWYPDKGEHYQIDRAMEAFGSGGLLGRGPGEGHVKDVLPDAHADFVFAVTGEEFGMVMCLVVLAVFAFVVLRGLIRLMDETDLFITLAAAGLVASFGTQALINMTSTLGLIPTKGMTLPFISYGGSSAIAVAFGMGLLLALTRRRPSPAALAGDMARGEAW